MQEEVEWKTKSRKRCVFENQQNFDSEFLSAPCPSDFIKDGSCGKRNQRKFFSQFFRKQYF